MRKPFQFKQFDLVDEQSAMKLSTDAVLLGSWIHPTNADLILDIGTGSGIIALMMAQRSKAVIDAIDIDMDSIDEAELNFNRSKWSGRLNAIHKSLQDFIAISSEQYDLILCNPPFFSNSLKSPYLNRTLSKHNEKLNYPDLLKGANQLLYPDGRFGLIIPFSDSDFFKDLAKSENLYTHHELVIYPKMDKTANRIIMEFRKEESEFVKTEELVIRNYDGSYTNPYKLLTREFYLNF